MPVHTIALLAAIGVLGLLSVRVVSVLYKHYGALVVMCPENRHTAGVELDVRRALVTGLVSSPGLRLASCSRWPEREGCGQECLSQIASGPEDCLVRRILSEWYGKQKCVFCGQPFGNIQWAVQKPALQVAGKASCDVGSIPAERLPEVLATAKAVCFACHTANTWVREHPDLMTDRSNRRPD